MGFVIDPAHGRSQPESGLAEMVVGRIDQSAENAFQAYVSRPVILPELPYVPPAQRLRRPRDFGGLANIRGRSAIGIGNLGMAPDLELTTSVSRRRGYLGSGHRVSRQRLHLRQRGVYRLQPCLFPIQQASRLAAT